MSVLHLLFIALFAVIGVLVFLFEYKNNAFYRFWIGIWSKNIPEKKQRGFFFGNPFWMRIVNSFIFSFAIVLLINTFLASFGNMFGFELWEMVFNGALGMFIGTGFLSLRITFQRIQEKGFANVVRDWVTSAKSMLSGVSKDMSDVSNDMKQKALEQEMKEEGKLELVVPNAVKSSEESDQVPNELPVSTEEVEVISEVSHEEDKADTEIEPDEEEEVLDLSDQPVGDLLTGDTSHEGDTAAQSNEDEENDEEKDGLEGIDLTHFNKKNQERKDRISKRNALRDNLRRK